MSAAPEDSFADVVEQAILRHVRLHELDRCEMNLIDTEAMSETIARGIKSWLGRDHLPRPTPKLSYENRYCEWLMGRYGRDDYEVRMEYRTETKDWWVWPVKRPEDGFRAEGHYEEVGRQAHEIADELRKVSMAQREARQAMRRAKAVAR